MKDSCYTSEVDGVFIDLDSYVSISYELEKIEELKLRLPEIEKSLDSIQVVKDSLTAIYLATTTNLTEMVALEAQSKNQLKERVFNLQHNYNVVNTKATKYKRQRNMFGGISGGALALLVIIIAVR